MSSIDWLTAHELPLGPFDGSLDLRARHRGRRLHLDQTCHQYQQMSPDRWPFTVTVPIPTINPAAHLCNRCAPMLEDHLRDHATPEGRARDFYLRHAMNLVGYREIVDQARKDLAALAADQRAPLALCDGVVRVIDELRAMLATAVDGGLVALVTPARDVLDQAEATLDQIRPAYATPAGRLVRARVLAVTAQMGKNTAQRPWPPAPDRIHHPSWVQPALRASYGAWTDSVRRGDPAQASQEAALAAANAPALAAGEDPTAGALAEPAALIPRLQETLGQYVTRTLLATAEWHVEGHVAGWEADLARRIGPDTDTLVPVYTTRGRPNREVRLSTPLARLADGAEWLAVPAAVAHQAKVTTVADVEALAYPPQVLETALRLIADGTAAATALEAAQAIHDPIQTP